MLELEQQFALAQYRNIADKLPRTELLTLLADELFLLESLKTVIRDFGSGFDLSFDISPDDRDILDKKVKALQDKNDDDLVFELIKAKGWQYELGNRLRKLIKGNP